MAHRIDYEKKRPVPEARKPIDEPTPRAARYFRYKQQDLKKQAEERRRRREGS